MTDTTGAARTLERPEAAPPLYSQDGRGYNAIVAAHYFVGGSDWLVTEYDPDQDLAFGWACLSGDRQNAELGYVSLAELEAVEVPLQINLNGHQDVVGMVKVEKDAHWPPCTLTEAIARLDGRRSTSGGEWTVSVRLHTITPGDRFVFEDKYGGEGQTLTASEHPTNVLGTWTLGTEELDFDLEFNGDAWIRLAR